jgi:1-deoxy-D-xylulose-5-phosphate reductoisomerase
LEKGGNIPCALNAANEVAVQAFIEDKISFLQIAEINGLTMERVSFVANPDLTSLVETNSMARRFAEEAISF